METAPFGGLTALTPETSRDPWQNSEFEFHSPLNANSGMEVHHMLSSDGRDPAG
jgi:hypothetical protein